MMENLPFLWYHYGLCRLGIFNFSKINVRRHKNVFSEDSETLAFVRDGVRACDVLGALADAQLADLDLLEDDDRSFGASVTAMPDPSTGAFAESRSAIMLLPLQIKVLNFEGGAGAYFTQSIVEGEIATALQWRVQGGPHWGKIGLQFYVEGLWKQGIDYAGFVRFGEFDLGRVILSCGLGTLVRADTQTELGAGIERNAAAGGDTKVKGLILGSAEIDTELV